LTQWHHWNPYNGPISPTSLLLKPLESKNSLVVLGSQFLTPLSSRCLLLVSPFIKNNNSSTTPFQNTRLVVNNG